MNTTSDTNIYLSRLIERQPILESCKNDIENAFELLHRAFQNGNKLLICGNGGSCSDAAHIAGELMKGFMSKRPLPQKIKQRLNEADPEHGSTMADLLQGTLPTVALSGNDPLASAISNDISGELVYAQQVLGLGREGDILLAISTSGTSKNVCRAVSVAHALNIQTIGLTGSHGGWLAKQCNCSITVPADTTPNIQELHLPIYHCLCIMLEDAFFAD
ncbi:SIS domain-containing protein [Coraliomargarita sp. SDUM461004]|uniref:SIS domain-containing protein n=1 Tax=Thalassobacterium sedimentorum TaxID=3041258 RepID=A0ABU1AN08_9BACT|nr:SIS domain-containing protein [Coraliomargarita sp. SDUM461004]MDQ8196181.1 SIS domain-containing protein [Coraliomargarita sp. SDUM461004]